MEIYNQAKENHNIFGNNQNGPSKKPFQISGASTRLKSKTVIGSKQKSSQRKALGDISNNGTLERKALGNISNKNTNAATNSSLPFPSNTVKPKQRLTKSNHIFKAEIEGDDSDVDTCSRRNDWPLGGGEPPFDSEIEIGKLVDDIMGKSKTLYRNDSIRSDNTEKHYLDFAAPIEKVKSRVRKESSEFGDYIYEDSQNLKNFDLNAPNLIDDKDLEFDLSDLDF
uniref:Uncharacterized protein n=1 Tax=Aplanochytrium stocchinoi TaxID=215587 RepID=A0A7S3PSN9_9STRA|mmetsp:Transcript_2142/g.2752  ORF Transcript_2142/g.2752 Transcript_2142/m.2752 type:complete len:225 (+) Transcript_2142:186-860(+)|eukprot:CAMPEP_0204828644 /NCGR_PEP_ID=MMETSP1346-20131115/6511_1 /ASSEMBLY_ACC=CAM_ASM_000771 /TAXON_ID=215587 /ORGANISM="Aplanochytrium stocchinoi, Strain GSBS06" /LENGTH=224 /DNA_ID=CAMNT_0051957873 /DNA_START=246 /DNA_END=920 /DNA_ORIENTATION=+